MQTTFSSKYHQLQFKTPGGTSRGILKTKDSWYVYSDEDKNVIGEVSIIEGLSIEDKSMIINWLSDHDQFTEGQDKQLLKHFPSISLAKEIFKKATTAVEPFHLFSSSFTNNNAGIPINGLVWMGEKKFMFDQIVDKIDSGFTCIKLKIGAINFEEELSLLSYIRSQFNSNEIEIRVDANGAFSVDDALGKLERLAVFELHSIEQPIKANQWQDMAKLCLLSPLDIALDEELIGVIDIPSKKNLLEAIGPQYIILKPSLIGGFKASEEWINIAEELGIGWWATSALESNIGLNAIAQWVATKNNPMPQGLGTGQLYTNNIESPLTIRSGNLFYDQNKEWVLDEIYNS